VLKAVERRAKILPGLHTGILADEGGLIRGQVDYSTCCFLFAKIGSKWLENRV